MSSDSPHAERETPEGGTPVRRRTAREAARGSRRAAIPWIVAPAVIAVVFVIGFGLRLLLA
jgi:hypothetical protein